MDTLTSLPPSQFLLASASNVIVDSINKLENSLMTEADDHSLRLQWEEELQKEEKLLATIVEAVDRIREVYSVVGESTIGYTW